MSDFFGPYGRNFCINRSLNLLGRMGNPSEIQKSKSGNLKMSNFFSVDDETLATVKDWACAEQDLFNDLFVDDNDEDPLK